LTKLHTEDATDLTGLETDETIVDNDDEDDDDDGLVKEVEVLDADDTVTAFEEELAVASAAATPPGCRRLRT
jgi:hypothetical protein